jgi:uncharacterized Tic20 family protein
MSYPPPPPGDSPEPYEYGGVPAVPTAEEKNWALAAHVGSFVAAWIALGFLCPLIVMLVKGPSSPFVRRHAVESLNFQISLLIYTAAAFLLVLVTFGVGALVIVPLAIIVGIAAIVVIVLATIKASNGEDYRYPLTMRFVS